MTLKLNKKIDRAPPTPTGDAKADVQALADYLAYLKEQCNYIYTLIYKELEG